MLFRALASGGTGLILSGPCITGKQWRCKNYVSQ